MIIVLLCIALAILSIALVVTTVLLVKVGSFVLALEDSVDESLDILEESYQGIASVLEIPVMTDEPYVRRVLDDIRRARGAIVLVADKISTFNDSKGDKEKE